MRVYIDNEFRCHASNPDGAYREVEDAFFDGKCTEFIEGFRLKPDGEIWVREDGYVFDGAKMISPWKDYNSLKAAQRKYERETLTEYEELINELYAEVTG